jgi:hypothetical protein
MASQVQVAGFLVTPAPGWLDLGVSLGWESSCKFGNHQTWLDFPSKMMILLAFGVFI